ncbi:MAG: aminopeptidase N [Micrococcales bacterium]|nr:aminopeptidase N [Micrococcales bacterium]
MPGQNLTRIEAEERSRILSVSNYDVRLDLSGESSVRFPSTSRVRFSCSEPGASSFIDLIAPVVHRVELNGRALDPASVFADSRIVLDDLEADNELVVEADCAFMRTSEGLHRFEDPVDQQVYLYTNLEVAECRRVFAVFEQPDLKASFTFEVLAPADWEVISNQPCAGKTPGDDGATVHRFPPTPRISSYLIAVIAGGYVGWSDELTSADGRRIPLGLFARRSLAEHVDAEELFDITKRGFEFFEPAFDFPYPFDKFDLLFVPEFNAGAMENVGAVTIAERYVFRSAVSEAQIERRAITILHELAHMWFGDLVTMRWWNDLWLNESFAEWAATVAGASNTCWSEAWTTFASVEKTWAYHQDQLPSTHPIAADIRDLADVEVNFDGITYAKGASVLRQLVSWVGEEAFLSGIAAYFKKHAWGNATLPDLLTQIEATSGRDLTEWSRLWLTSAGVNTLTVHLDDDGPGAGGGVITSLQLAQSAVDEHPILRPHRFGLMGLHQDESGHVVPQWHEEIDITGETTDVVTVQGKARSAIVLANCDDAGYVKVRPDAESLDCMLALLGLVEGALERAVIWGTVWELTRDGEFAARRYAGFVQAWAGMETNSSTLQTVLRNLATTLTHYVAPEDRELTAASVAGHLMEMTWGAPAGSDRQLQLLKAFAAHARTDSQLEVIEALLDSRTVLEGREIDTDLRWELLNPLVVAGKKGVEAIEEFLEEDSSAKGRAWAARLRAAIPTPEAKAEAWRLATEDGAATNEIQGAVIAGFGDVHDRGLLTPYVEPYFAILEDQWAARSLEMSSKVISGLYPALVAGMPGVDVVGATEAWLEALGDRTPALRRLVIEAKAEVERALRVQAVDASL